jgi:hypothetical protein
MSKRIIAKKTRPVKGKKPQKPVSAPRRRGVVGEPRYTIRKDSLGRRYAIDKHTGQRVSTSKADKERVKRRKAATKAREELVFYGIQKQPKVKITRRRTKKSRSEAAKKGWETRRQRKVPVEPVPFAQALGIPSLYFEGIPMRVLNGIADRSERYEKVKLSADISWYQLQSDAYAKLVEVAGGRKAPPRPTPKFDRMFGERLGDMIRTHLFAQARSLEDIDAIVEQLAEDPDNDYTTRELYTLYFSPEVA